ncbi:MAG: zinc-dependent metalloprotease family protein [Phycisphaerales bacterium]
MKTRIALPHVLAGSALILWAGHLTAQVPIGIRAPADQVVMPGLLRYDLQTLDLPATEQEPFTAAVRLGDQMQTLVLNPYTMRAEDFQVLVKGEDGQLREVEPPPPRTYRGTVQGEPLSRVAATLMDGQLWAMVAQESGGVWFIQPLSEFGVAGVPDANHVIYQGEDVEPVDGFCGTDDIAQPLADLGDRRPGGDPTAGTGWQRTEIAFDADHEFFLLNGSSVSTTVHDIEFVMNFVESIYETDTDITYEVTAIVVRTGEPDPYTSSDCVTLLNQFRNTWNTSPEYAIRRAVAQLFTGKDLSGCAGIAFVGTVCHAVNSYSVVQSSLPGIPFALRVALSAHEIGHSWNALHCSTLPPECEPIGDCRIMCACLGGCLGFTSFGPVAINFITAWRNNVGCLVDVPLPLDPPFFDDFPDVNPDAIKWVYNVGGVGSIDAENEPSPPRSLNLDATGSSEYEDDYVRSTFIQLAGKSGDGLVVSYYTEHIGVNAGEQLIVEYWSLGLVWEEINTITSDGVDQNEFDFWTHDLDSVPGDPFHNEFRLQFRTQVNQLNDDWFIDDVFVGAPSTCPWDLDDNGTVGASDLLSLLVQWGTDPGGPPDFDGDGNVGASDLLDLLANWGPCR